MRSLHLLSGLILFLVFFSCSREEKYKGFGKSGSGLFYKIKSIGDGNKKARQGDYLLLHITYRSEKDAFISDSSTIIQLGLPSFKGSFEEGLTLMNEGDHFIFIQSVDSLIKKFFKMVVPSHLTEINFFKMEIKLEKIISEIQVATERQKMIDDADMEEQRRLKQYIKENKITAIPTNGGIYCLPLKKTTGKKSENGKTVTVQYTGCFLDGKPFNFSEIPLEFTLGDQYQVIKGLEYGISLMREGEKAKFIIPSQFAYGEKGSSTGIVPPYTTVIYEVELLTVK